MGSLFTQGTLTVAFSGVIPLTAYSLENQSFCHQVNFYTLKGGALSLVILISPLFLEPTFYGFLLPTFVG